MLAGLSNSVNSNLFYALLYAVRVLDGNVIGYIEDDQKLYNLINGKHKILNKKPTDIGKPNSKVVLNYPHDIVHNYLGYMTGIPITYSSDLDIDSILDVLNYNDVHDEDSEFLRQALQYGIAYELNYVDLEGKQRFKVLDSREMIPVYDNTLDQVLISCIRFNASSACKTTS